VRSERLRQGKARGSTVPVDIVSLIATAASLSLLAGWRVYVCVLATGLAMRFGWIALPDHLQSLQVIASPWVLAAAGFGALAEFFADKVAWIDSLWDAVHTAIRPVGGALLALAVVDAADPKWQVVSVLLGGGAALMSHTAKAGSRAVINASPEPFSNIAVSTGEDVSTTGLVVLALANPIGAAIVAVGVTVGSVALLVTARRLLARISRAFDTQPEASADDAAQSSPVHRQQCTRF
jgi:Domain of unknown function (DUF4126)